MFNDPESMNIRTLAANQRKSDAKGKGDGA